MKRENYNFKMRYPKGSKFSVSYLLCDGTYKSIQNLTFEQAVDRFLFYIHLAIEEGVQIKLCYITLGKRCIKLYQNY